MNKEKLLKIKALAEKGVGGEKETAIILYNKLLKKYEIDEKELEEEHIERRWFKYKDAIGKTLLSQIFYKVTGQDEYYEKKDKRLKTIGIDCTEFEMNEILFYYSFYRKHLDSELEIFISAFINKNSIFPDKTARCYNEDAEGFKLDIDKQLRILEMSKGIKKKTPNIMIEEH